VKVVVMGVGCVAFSLYDCVGNRAVKVDAGTEAAEAAGVLEKQRGAVRWMEVEGVVTRERWDVAGQAWVGAGETEAHVIYEGKSPWRVRVVEAKEGGKRMEAVYTGKAGAVVEQGAGEPVVRVEKGRPAALEGCDEATGWRYTFYGRWVGAGSAGESAADLVTGKEAGVTMGLAEGGMFLRVTGRRAGVEEMWSLDRDEDFALDAWEERVVGPEGTRLRRSMDVSRFWRHEEVVYPHMVAVMGYGADGTAAERERIEVKRVVVNPAEGAGPLRVAVPFGKVRLVVGGEERELDGTGTENTGEVEGIVGRMSGE
jgi:hypothetical protein